MKPLLRKLFWPILRHFEKNEEAPHYKASQRIILNVVGGLFLFLSLASGIASIYASQFGALIPVVVFFVVSLVLLVVGSLGTDAAVARIWGNR
tara:strand:+ start:1864 stop:2142 length:279 start_codon:yes stop_codon:yes gene_type:complete